jgi:hypothetical protein
LPAYSEYKKQIFSIRSHYQHVSKQSLDGWRGAYGIALQGERVSDVDGIATCDFFRGWYMFTALEMSCFWHHGLIQE